MKKILIKNSFIFLIIFIAANKVFSEELRMVASEKNWSVFNPKDKNKCLRILEQLKAEGTPETLILWSVAREITNLYKIKSTGSSNGIWGPSFYISSLEESSKNTDKKIIESCIKKIASIDSSIKGQNKDKPWTEIKDLTLEFIIS